MKMLLICILLFTTIGLYADGVQPEGSGTENNPYLVENLDNLLWLSTNPISWDKYFTQTGDIDATETQNWNNGEGFSPVGISEQSFNGFYDGQNHIIDGIYINRPEDNHQGLFGRIEFSEVSNLEVTNVLITGHNNCGGLAGTITGNSVISQCSSSGEVNGNNLVGGLVGENWIADVFNSYSVCNVTGYNYVGGLLGHVWTCDVSFCYSAGSVIGFDYCGGFAGLIQDVIVINSYTTCNVSGNSHIGGLIGKNHNTSVIKCYSSGFVLGNSHTGGLIGSDWPSSIVENSFWDIETSGQEESNGGSGKTTEEMTNIATYTSLETNGLDETWDFVLDPFDDVETEEYWDLNSLYNSGYPFLRWQNLCNYGTQPNGSGLEDDPYLVENLENLLWMSTTNCNFLFFHQIVDIDASETQNWNNGDGFLQINGYEIYYNGLDHTINNLYINRPESDCRGLFGVIDSSTILNLNLIDGQIIGGVAIGQLIGSSSNSTVRFCTSSGIVSGNAYIGGIIGSSSSDLISNCSSTGEVHADMVYSGGLIGGTQNSTVVNCYSSSDVYSSSKSAGFIGGIFGNSNVVASYSTGDVFGNQNSGGFIAKCDDSNISDSYSTGNVYGESSVFGGFIGYAYSHSEIINCFCTGTVHGESVIGGFIGRTPADDYIIENCFWDIETSGQTESAGGTGKTTAEMMDIATYTSLETEGLDESWDFVGNPFDDTGVEDFWDIDLNIIDGYPFLTYEPIVDAEDENVQPYTTQIQLSNYPNPFNPSTTIEFSIQFDSIVELTIFNIKGQKIKTFAKNYFLKGLNSIIWNGDDENKKPVSAGIYLYKINVNNKTEVVEKCLLLK